METGSIVAIVMAALAIVAACFRRIKHCEGPSGCRVSLSRNNSTGRVLPGGDETLPNIVDHATDTSWNRDASGDSSASGGRRLPTLPSEKVGDDTPKGSPKLLRS